MKIFNFDVPPKQKKSRESEPSKDTLVHEARDAITFVGKRNANAESLESFRSAKQATIAFLEGIGQPEAAKRVRALAEKGQMFFFSALQVEKSPGETDTFRPSGMYSWEYGAVGIGEWLLAQEGQDGVRKTTIHELIHHASFIEGDATVHPVRFDDRTLLRRQGGFDIVTSRPELAYDDEVNKNRFTALNEGMTETLACMVDSYGWQNPHSYDANRYLVQLLMRALAAKEAGPTALRDSWLLLSNAYFQNDFSFGKKVDALLGAGTLRTIANFDVEKGKTDAERAASNLALIEHLAAEAGLPFNREEYDILVAQGAVSRIRATLKSMEDELRRAALSAPPLRKAA